MSLSLSWSIQRVLIFSGNWKPCWCCGKEVLLVLPKAFSAHHDFWHPWNYLSLVSTSDWNQFGTREFLRLWKDNSGEDYIKPFLSIKDRALTHVRAQGQVPLQVLMKCRMLHLPVASYANFRLVCWQRRPRRHRNHKCYKTYENFHILLLANYSFITNLH